MYRQLLLTCLRLLNCCRSYDMVKSKDWHNALARTLRWRYLVLDEGENGSTSLGFWFGLVR